MDMNNMFASVNWQEVQPASGGREVFEEGWTQVVISDSKGVVYTEEKRMGLTLYLKAVAGANNGKTIDDYINVFHTSTQAQEIGQRQFSAYCHATGEFKPVDNHASNLRNRPFWVRTVIEEGSYTPAGKTEAVKTRKSIVKDWDTNNGTKHGAAAVGNGSATAKAPTPAPTGGTTAAPSEPAKAEWGAPPPGAGAETGNGGGWATGGAAAQPASGGENKAPWNS